MEKAKKIRGEIVITETVIKDIQKRIKNIPDFKEMISASLDRRTTELLEVILVGAVISNASDIHIEPEEEQTKFRVRIDGLLQDVLEIDPKIYKALLSRIKLLSKLKLNVSDRPQDGRFSILMDKTPIEIRTSVLPAEYGESTVLRILDPKSLIDLEALGLRKNLLEIFHKEIKKPNGMIIVTGPTGSGKTTTLYAFLKKINKPAVKIITLEDPIEYHLKGISQTQVDAKKGYDFSDGLRSIMRQDPDVVLVGEIRDLKTAQTALQAALTGHLVFTTLHTNDAAGTIARLQALGEKAINIAPAVNMAIAQRLVRTVCQKCVKLVKPSREDLAKIKKALKGLTDIPEINENSKIAEIKGCSQCNSTGYQGRIAIFEVLLVDDEIERLILKNPSIIALRDLAIKKGMIPMRKDGFIKVLEGITTIEEVERLT